MTTGKALATSIAIGIAMCLAAPTFAVTTTPVPVPVDAAPTLPLNTLTLTVSVDHEHPNALTASQIVAAIQQDPTGDLARDLGFPAAAVATFPSAGQVDRSILPAGSAYLEMERFVSLRYVNAVTASAAKVLLANDERFAFVDFVQAGISVAPSDEFYQFPAGSTDPDETRYQWALRPGFLNMETAWNFTPGTGRMGQLDNSINIDHPDLLTRVNNLAMYDFYYNDKNMAYLIYEGVNLGNHGTHVAGIAMGIPDNPAPGQNVGRGIVGVCWSCTNAFASYLDASQLPNAGTWATGWGSQVINHSGFIPNDLGHYQSVPDGTPCATAGKEAHPYCAVLALAAERDVAYVASSGNHKSFVHFPANEPDAIAVGGVDKNGTLWDETLWPVDSGDRPDGCPNLQPLGSTRECGSNFGPEQDFVAPSRRIVSAFVAGTLYGQHTCQDSTLPPVDDGFGLCTGTSMSAPHVSGAMTFLRSINPLVRKDDLFDLMKVNTDQVGFTNQRGWGVPNVTAATHRLMGRSCTSQVQNRLTPMFMVRNVTDGDRLYTTVPQIAASAMTGELFTEPCVTHPCDSFPAKQLRPYGVPSSAETVLVPNYTYPGLAAGTPARAAFDVLSGKISPFGGVQLVPLYRLSFAASCDWRDNIYITNSYQLNVFTTYDFCPESGTQTYDYDGIEGFLLATCPAQFGTCTSTDPAAPQRLYRAWSDAHQSYALILHSQLGLAEFATYTTQVTLLGYAFPRVDSDYDGLTDAFERILQTYPYNQDSDGDLVPDGVEYPMHSVQPEGADPTDGVLSIC